VRGRFCAFFHLIASTMDVARCLLQATNIDQLSNDTIVQALRWLDTDSPGYFKKEAIEAFEARPVSGVRLAFPGCDVLIDCLERDCLGAFEQGFETMLTHMISDHMCRPLQLMCGLPVSPPPLLPPSWRPRPVADEGLVAW
jgi:hypothetical protein